MPSELESLNPAVSEINPELNAIAYNESRGRYDAVGPVTSTGDKAYGRYQIMGQYIPSLTKQYLGKELTPEQFKKDPHAQDKVANAQWNKYREKYNMEDAAKVWAGGEGGLQHQERQDVLGTTIQGYGKSFTDVYNKLYGNTPNYTPLPANTQEEMTAAGFDPKKYQENLNRGILKGGDSYFGAYKSLYGLYDKTATPTQQAENKYYVENTKGSPVVKTVLHAGDDFRSAFANTWTDFWADIKEVGSALEHSVGITNEKEFKEQTKNIQRDKAYQMLQISANGQKDAFSLLPDGSINWNGLAAGAGGMIGGFTTLAPAIVLGGLVTYFSGGADIPILAGLTAADVTAMAGSSATFAVQEYGSGYEDGLRRGLTNDQAATYGGMRSIAGGLAGAIPGGYLSKRLFGAATLEMSEKALAQWAEKGYTQEALNTLMPEFQDGLKTAFKNRLIATGKNVLQEGGVVAGVMGAQETFDKIATYQYAQIANQQDKFRDVLDKSTEENFKDIFKSSATGAMMGMFFGLGHLFKSAAHPTLYGYVEANANKPENIEKLKGFIKDYGDKTGTQTDDMVQAVDDMRTVATTYGKMVSSPDARYQIFQFGEESKKIASDSEHAKVETSKLQQPNVDPNVAKPDVEKWNQVIALNAEKQGLVTKYLSAIGDTKKPINFDEYNKQSREINGKIDNLIKSFDDSTGKTKPAEPVVDDQKKEPEVKAEPKTEEPTDLDNFLDGKKPVAPKTVKDVFDVPVTISGQSGFISDNEGTLEFTTESGKVHQLGKTADYADKPFETLGIKPEDVNQYQLRQKMQREQERTAKKKAAEVPLESLNGKQVRYKGITGTLGVDEGGKVTFEGGGKTYDISTEADKRNALDYGIEPIKTPQNYKITEVSETGATVDGQKYNIVIDDKGNISGLTPMDKPEQVIKNEKLLTAVESARNKILYEAGGNATKEQIDGIVKLLSPEEQGAETLIDNIQAAHMTPEVAESIDLLTANHQIQTVKYLTPEQHSGIMDWALKSLEGLQKLQVEEKYKNSEQIKQAIDDIDFITKIADQNVESTDTGTKSGENHTEPKGNEVEKQQEGTGLAEGDKQDDVRPVEKPQGEGGETEQTGTAQGTETGETDKATKGAKPAEEDSANEIKKRAARKNVINTERKKLLSKEPTSLREAIMQFFVGGGKVNTGDVKRYLGTKGKADWQDLIGMHKNGGNENSADLIATNQFGDWIKNGVEEQDVVNEIFDVLQTFGGKRSAMEAELRGAKEHEEFLAEHGMSKEQYEQINKQHEAEQALIKHYGLDREEAEPIVEAVDSEPMTSEEIEKLSAEFDEWIKAQPEDIQEQLLNSHYGFDKEPDERGEGPIDEEGQSTGSTQDQQRNKQQERLTAAKERLTDATSEYEKANKALKEDLGNKQTGLFEGKEQKLFDDTKEMSNRVAQAKTKMEEAQREVDNLQKVVDENLKGQEEFKFQKQSEASGTPISKETATLFQRVLSKAFPNVGVSLMSAEEFEKLHPGENGLGVTNPDGTVHINLGKVTGQTQMHEMGHIWSTWAKKFAPDLYKTGIELAEKEKGIHEAIKAEGYDLEGNALYEETLARMIGAEGEKLDIKDPTTITDKAKTWVKNLWSKLSNYVKNKLGIKDTRFDNIKDLPFKDFAAAIGRELISGKEISSINSKEIAAIEKDGISRYQLADKEHQPREVFKKNPNQIGVALSNVSPIGAGLSILGQFRKILGGSAEVNNEHLGKGVDFIIDKVNNYVDNVLKNPDGTNKNNAGGGWVIDLQKEIGKEKNRNAIKEIMEAAAKSARAKKTPEEWHEFFVNKNIGQFLDTPFENLSDKAQKLFKTPEEFEAAKQKFYQEPPINQLIDEQGKSKFEYKNLSKDAKRLIKTLGEFEVMSDREEEIKNRLFLNVGVVSHDPNADKAETNKFAPFQEKQLDFANKNKVTKKSFDVIRKGLLSIADISTWAFSIEGTKGMFYKAYDGLSKGYDFGFRLKSDNSKLINPYFELANQGREKTLAKTKGMNLRELFPDNKDIPDTKISWFEMCNLQGLLQAEDINKRFGPENVINADGGVDVMLDNSFAGERGKVKFTVTKRDYEALQKQFTPEQIKIMNDARNETAKALHAQENPVHESLTATSIPEVENYEPRLNVSGNEDNIRDYQNRNSYINDVTSHKLRDPSLRAVYLIQDPQKVWGNRIDQGAEYAGMALPMHNMNVLMRYSKQDMTRLEMKPYMEYWNKQQVDLTNYEKPVSEMERFIMNNFITATIGFNPFIDLKHFSTIPLASGVVRMKYLTASSPVFFENYANLIRNLDPLNSGKANKFTPLLNEMFEDNFAFMRYHSGTDELQSRLRGDKGKVPFPVFRDGKWQTIQMDKKDFPAMLKVMETAQGSVVWNAAKMQVETEYPHLSAGTPEFKEKVGEIYKEAIVASQPSFDPIHRSFYSKGAFDQQRGVINKTLSLFAGQPIAAFNYMVKRGVAMMANPSNVNRFQFAKAITNVFIMNGLIVAAVNTFRQKSLGSAKTKDDFTDNFINSIIGSTPILGPVFETFRSKVEHGIYGNNLDYPAVEEINGIAKTVADATNGKEKQAFNEGIRSVSALLGIPTTPILTIKKLAE